MRPHTQSPATPARTREAHHPGTAIAGLCAAVLFSACASAPPRQETPFQSVPEFSARAGVARTVRWWESFGDPSLTAHVDRGLAASFTLRAAYERVVAARAVARRVGADLWPALDGFVGASVQDVRGSGATQPQRSELQLGVAASYELDLWGRIRASRDAAALEALATEEDYEAVAIALSADIAIVLYRLTEAQAQRTLIESQLQTNRDVLEVIESRFAIGQSNAADVLRQRQLVESTNEQRIVESQSAELLQNLLAVLEGEPPQGQSTGAPPAELPTLPPLPEVGLPAELLDRRPDIRAAFARLESEDAAVAAAVRDQYPSITLSGSLATTAENASGLFSTWVQSLAAGLVAPLFDGGARASEVERAVAVRRQRLAEYGDVVLDAFREVEDALAAERRQAERIASLERQLAFANSTYTELRSQYLNGAADFIDVLVALRDHQGLERSLLEARLLHVEARIALHRAIAGRIARPTDDERQP